MCSRRGRPDEVLLPRRTRSGRSQFQLRHRDEVGAPAPPARRPVRPRGVRQPAVRRPARVEGQSSEGSRYTLAQRHRLLREGAKEFFRINGLKLEIMGDCGAFSYLKEKAPPVTPDEVIDFYEACRFDYGVSIDHIILAYEP